MSRSYHKTLKDLKDKTKKEIDEMFDDPDSILNELAKKRSIKKATKNKRRQIRRNENEL